MFWIIDDTYNMDEIVKLYPAPTTHRKYLTEVHYYLVAEAHLLELSESRFRTFGF